MPEIPTFTAGPTPFERDPAHLDPGALAAPGLALERAGAQTERTAQDLGELVQRHNIRAYNEALADATTTAIDAHEAGKEEVRTTGNYQGFTQRQLANFDTYTQQALENAPSAVQGQLERRFATLRRSIQIKSSAFEHQMGSQAEYTGHEQDIDKSGINVYRDPALLFDQDGHPGEYTRIGAAIEASGMSGSLNPKQIYELRRKLGDTLAGAAIRGRAESDPAGLAADFKSGRYDSFLTPQSLEHLTPFVSGARARAAGDAIAGRMFGGGGTSPTGLDAGFQTSLNTMLADAKAAGFDLSVGSGLRTHEHQAELYRADLAKHGGQPSGMVAAPGHSMHESGLAADLVDASGNTISGAAADWVRQHAGDYGIAVPMQGHGGVNEPWHVEPVGARQKAAAGRGPDLDAGLAAVQHQVDAGELTPEEGDKASGIVARRYHEWHQATAQERAQLLGDTENAIAMLASGRDAAIDQGAIRRLLPAEKADELLRKADEARESGNAVNRVQFASPADLVDLQAKAMAGLNDPTDFARKQRQAKALAMAIDQRTQQLDPVKGDPAAYAMAAPAVDAAFRAAPRIDAVDPENAPGAGTQAAIQASLAEQERLGVPEENRRALPKPWAAELVRQITTTDPGKADIAALLDQTARKYGQYWPRVFGDLVRQGLPPEAQILGALDHPDQAAARADFQRMLATIAEKKGAEQLKQAAPHSEVQLIDQGLDARLADLRASMWPDIHAFDAWKAGVRDLAYFYAFNGRSGPTALENAAQGLIDRKYDFDGRLRVPKGTLGTVEAAGDAVLAGVKPEQLGDIAGDPTLTPAQRQGIALSAIQRGYWRTNEDDTGAVRMAVRRDGLAVPAIVDGRRLEFRFSDAARLAAGAASPVGPDQSGGL